LIFSSILTVSPSIAINFADMANSLKVISWKDITYV
jgi:hypothetical protein